MGDAICAAVGANLYADLSTAGETMVHVDQVLQPNPANRGVYDDLFGVYQAAYPALRPFFPSLARAARHIHFYT